MSAVEIEQALSDLEAQDFDRAEFPFQFLEAFGNMQIYEAKYPQLNPAGASWSEADAADVARRLNAYRSEGMNAPDALTRAVEEWAATR